MSANENGVQFIYLIGKFFRVIMLIQDQRGYSKEEILGRTTIEVKRNKFLDLNELKKMQVFF